MTAAPDRIGGESEFDRAVSLAEAMGVRVVATTREWLLERYGCTASAVLVTRSTRGVSIRGITNRPDKMEPGESRMYLTPERNGDALAVLHELGHAALHRDGRHRRTMTTAEILKQEIEAWQWAIPRLGRELTPRERQDITVCLRGYQARFSEIRTHVLPKITL